MTNQRSVDGNGGENSVVNCHSNEYYINNVMKKTYFIISLEQYRYVWREFYVGYFLTVWL